MKSEIEVFRKFVRDKGLRNTPEREQVIRTIFAIHDHFDVDDLHLRLHKDDERISKATIYRTIPLLIECGLIQEAYFEDGHMHYEHIYGHEHHCHLRCLNCGQVVEFIDETGKTVEEKLEKHYDFQITGHKLDVYGYCPKCKVHV
jgi:Fur family ferric uptake transcriptional regulator